MNPRLRVALKYAGKGWPVLPCAPDGKPLCELVDATTDEALIREWWARWPRANICTPTGKRVVAVIVDGAEGEHTLVELEAKHGSLPPTMTVGTGRGRHLHFFPNGAAIPNGGGTLGPGLDVLGTGQHAILPPSTDEDGLRSEWLSLVEPAPLPAWVAQALITAETPQEKPLEAKGDVTAVPIGKLECAKRFLLKALKDGAVKSEAAKRQAMDAGYSEKTIYRARKALGVEVRKVGFGEGQHWEWLTQTKLAKKKAKMTTFESSHGTLLDRSEASGLKAGESGGLYGAIPVPFPDAEWRPDAQKGGR